MPLSLTPAPVPLLVVYALAAAGPPSPYASSPALFPHIFLRGGSRGGRWRGGGCAEGPTGDAEQVGKPRTGSADDSDTSTYEPGPDITSLSEEEWRSRRLGAFDRIKSIRAFQSIQEGRHGVAGGGGRNGSHLPLPSKRRAIVERRGDPTDPDPGIQQLLSKYPFYRELVYLGKMSKGKVTVVAGYPRLKGCQNGAGIDARFGRITGIAIDYNRNIYISDTDHHVIWRIQPDSGIAIPFWGEGRQERYPKAPIDPWYIGMPSGLAVNRNGTMLFIADTYYARVRSIDLTNHDLSDKSKGGTFCGTGRAYIIDAISRRHFLPFGLAANGSQLVISDPTYHQLRFYPFSKAKEIYESFPVCIPQPYLEPHKHAFPFAGISSDKHHGYLNGPSDIAQFKAPHGLVYDRKGNVFVADTKNHVVRKVDKFGSVSTYVGFHKGPRTLGNEGGHRDGKGLNCDFKHPQGLAIDKVGNLFVADTGNHVIRMVTPSRQVTTVAGRIGLKGSKDGPALLAMFRRPSAIAVDRRGDIYIADSGNFCVRKLQLHKSKA